MIELYLWLKTLHLISVITWAGSMLLLPWLFVILVKHHANPDKELLLLEIIRLLIKRAINFAMITTYITGGGLIWVLTQTGGLIEGWLHAKLTLVLILTVCHGLLARSRRKITQHGDAPKSLRFYYTIAAIVTICIFGAVFLVVQKPV